MKKITLCTIFLIGSLSTFAQKTEEKKTTEEHPKHEIGMDILSLIGLKKYEFNYDYLLNESESIGTEISFSSDNEDFIDNQGFQENFTMSLNYKHYFSKKYAKGFYLEALAKYSHGKAFLEDLTTSDFLLNDYKKYNALDVGFGIGYKFVSKKNFFIDANIDITRNLTNSLSTNDDYNIPKAISNIGITIGKRF